MRRLLTYFFSVLTLAIMAPSSAHAGLFGTNPSHRNITDIMEGYKGGIIVSFQIQKGHCGSAKLVFRSLSTGKKHKARMTFFTSRQADQLTVMTVPPGQYQIIEAFCEFGNRTYVFKDIAEAYGPVTVMPGEVVYPGTYSPAHSGRSVMGYDLYDRSHEKAQLIMKRYPMFGHRFIPRFVHYGKPSWNRVARRR